VCSALIGELASAGGALVRLPRCIGATSPEGLMSQQTTWNELVLRLSVWLLTPLALLLLAAAIVFAD
jgi:hypothetical protein